jgi:hypothetical protein
VSGPIGIVCPSADQKATVPGSARDACSQCKAAVWISPASQAVRARAETLIFCLDCYSKAGSNLPHVPLVTTAAHELERRQVAEDMRRRVVAQRELN